MKIVIAYAQQQAKVDGIRDYATHLAAELRRAGGDADLRLVPPGRGCAAGLIGALPRDRPAALVLQYNPFSWGRWGVAPGLCLALAAVRRRRPQARIMLMVHESWVPMRDARWVVMGAWQRAQLRVLLLAADRALATTAVVTAELSRAVPSRAVEHLPVSSNLPDQRDARNAERARAGYGGRLVVAAFQTGHESHLRDHVQRAAQAVARASSDPVILLLLGSGDVPPAGLDGVERIVAPGYLEQRALARALCTADIFLAPFTDGASTRRTTLMAALQHGLATVTTTGERTDPVLLDPEVFGPAIGDDADRFCAEAVALALDPALRERRGLAGRALFARCFDWPVLCARLSAAIGAAGGVSAPGSRR
ncbi:MAG: glycosyltransferase [Solirubrobacteraceae bacterium]|jgi:glycosyltransferase involved in cell wall biosynthesis